MKLFYIKQAKLLPFRHLTNQTKNILCSIDTKESKAMLKKEFVQATVTAASIATFLTVATPGAIAHHGWSEYNNQQTLNLTGEIRSVSYSSPHVTIQLQAAKKVWLAVLAPPSRLQRRGLPIDTLRVGQKVRVVGYPHRSDANEMRAERIVVGDRTIELR